MSRAAGFDPGLAAAGLGCIERVGQRLGLLHVETIRTESDEPLLERQRKVFTAIQFVIITHHPDVLAIEDQSGVQAAARGQQFAAMKAIREGREPPRLGFNASNDGVTEMVGIAKACAFAYGVRVVMVQPRPAKIALCGPGGGRATPEQMKQALARILDLPKRISSHGIDSLALSIAGDRVEHIESRRVG